MFALRALERSFRRGELDQAILKAERNALTKAGAFVRLTARRSIKPAGRRSARDSRRDALRGRRDPNISKPGQPPRLHTRAAQNLKLIRFAFVPKERLVVVGPLLFKSVSGVRIPQVLEHGGRSFVRRKFIGKKPVRIRKRPFMQPALQAEMPKFPNLFANSVKF